MSKSKKSLELLEESLDEFVQIASSKSLMSSLLSSLDDELYAERSKMAKDDGIKLSTFLPRLCLIVLTVSLSIQNLTL